MERERIAISEVFKRLDDEWAAGRLSTEDGAEIAAKSAEELHAELDELVGKTRSKSLDDVQIASFEA
jgi:hypothetical protein